MIPEIHTRRTSARDSLERALDLDTLMRLRDIASERWKDSDRMKKRRRGGGHRREEKEEEEEEGWERISHLGSSHLSAATTCIKDNNKNK